MKIPAKCQCNRLLCGHKGKCKDKAIGLITSGDLAFAFCLDCGIDAIESEHGNYYDNGYRVHNYYSNTGHQGRHFTIIRQG